MKTVKILEELVPVGESGCLPIGDAPPSLLHGLDDGVFADLGEPLIEERGVTYPILGCHTQRPPNGLGSNSVHNPVHNFRPNRANEGLLSGQ
jgi:hypothetical protein